MSRPRSTADGAPNRRHDILMAAERLFSERGYHGTSVRDIADAAGVPLALVGYYYGPKVELYHAIFRARSDYIDARLAALARARAEPAPGPRLEAIVRAFVLPALAVAASPEGRQFLRLMARGMSEHLEEDEPVIRELFDPLAHAFIDALADALAPVPRETAAWGYQFALGSLLHHLTDLRIERLSRGLARPGDADTAGPLLVRFIIDGLRGAASPQRSAS